MNITEIIAELKRNLTFLERDYSVKNIGIFGSFARGEQTNESDIDVLVEFSKPVGFFHLVRLEDFLSSRLGRKIDLVTKNALKPAIKDEILNQVKMI